MAKNQKLKQSIFLFKKKRNTQKQALRLSEKLT